MIQRIRTFKGKGTIKWTGTINVSGIILRMGLFSER